MAKEYETFLLTEKIEEIPLNREFEIWVRELTPEDRRKKYLRRFVRAVIFRDPDREKDDIVWFVFQRGIRHEEPFGIKIVQVLGDIKPEPPMWGPVM